jgi:hypothetical protein
MPGRAELPARDSLLLLLLDTMEVAKGVCCCASKPAPGLSTAAEEPCLLKPPWLLRLVAVLWAFPAHPDAASGTVRSRRVVDEGVAGRLLLLPSYGSTGIEATLVGVRLNTFDRLDSVLLLLLLLLLSSPGLGEPPELPHSPPAASKPCTRSLASSAPPLLPLLLPTADATAALMLVSLARPLL